MFDKDSNEVTNFSIDTISIHIDTLENSNMYAKHLNFSIGKFYRYKLNLDAQVASNKYKLSVLFDDKHELFKEFKIVKPIEVAWEVDKQFDKNIDSINIKLTNKTNEFYFIGYGKKYPFVKSEFVSYKNGKIFNSEVLYAESCFTGTFYTPISKNESIKFYDHNNMIYIFRNLLLDLEKLDDQNQRKLIQKNFGDSTELYYSMEARMLRWSEYESQIIRSKPIKFNIDELYSIFKFIAKNKKEKGL